jgi:hypothetical protein
LQEIENPKHPKIDSPYWIMQYIAFPIELLCVLVPVLKCECEEEAFPSLFPILFLAGLDSVTADFFGQVRISQILYSTVLYTVGKEIIIKGIVSPDWKGLQMVSLDRFEV